MYCNCMGIYYPKFINRDLKVNKNICLMFLLRFSLCRKFSITFKCCQQGFYSISICLGFISDSFKIYRVLGISKVPNI